MTKRKVKLPVITESVARQTWLLTELEDKKLFLLDYIGLNFNTDEQAKIRIKIQKARTPNSIDILVTNMLLKTEGTGTFK